MVHRERMMLFLGSGAVVVVAALAAASRLGGGEEARPVQVDESARTAAEPEPPSALAEVARDGSGERRRLDGSELDSLGDATSAGAEQQKGGHRAALRQRLEEVAASFLTDEPRLEELRDVMAALGEHARIDPDSFRVDDAGDLIAKVTVDTEPPLEGSLRITPERYALDFPLSADPERFWNASLTLAFGEDATEGMLGVQYHPKTTSPGVRAWAAQEGGAVLGHSAVTSVEEGTVLDPILMRPAERGALQIGRLEGRDVERRPWDADRRAFLAWEPLLRRQTR